MARSGSYDFTANRDEIIKAAIRIITGRGGKLSSAINASQEITYASQALNMLIKAWQVRGIGLWKNTEIIVFPAYDTRSYDLGPAGDHATSTLVETEIATAASSGGTSIVVDSDDGISDADYIGIELDDNTLQWSTVNGTPSSNTIALDDALTDDVAVDNNVYTYATVIQRPLSITEARLYRDAGTEVPLNILTREQYMNIADKTINGVPNQIYYDPQLDNGKLYVWPVFDTVYDYIKATARMPVQDMDATANNFDFPPEWLRALKFNLAHEISPEYIELDANALAWIERMADKSRIDVETFDAEHGSIYIGVDNN